MAGYQGTATRHDPHEYYPALAESERRATLTTLGGQIVSYDAKRQKATVQPRVSMTIDGEKVRAPELLEVPVTYPRMGKFVFHAPLQAGNELVLHVAQRSMESAIVDGGDVDLAAGRMSSLSDSVASPSSYSDKAELPKLPGDGLHVGSDDGKKGDQVKNDGTVKKVGGPDGEDKFKVAPSGKIDIFGGPGAAGNRSLLAQIRALTQGVQGLQKAFNAIGSIPGVAAALSAAGVSLPTDTATAILGHVDTIWTGE